MSFVVGDGTDGHFQMMTHVHRLVPFTGEFIPGRRIPPVLVKLSVGKADIEIGQT
jgi:hypothetical protein